MSHVFHFGAFLIYDVKALYSGNTQYMTVGIAEDLLHFGDMWFEICDHVIEMSNKNALRTIHYDNEVSTYEMHEYSKFAMLNHR